MSHRLNKNKKVKFDILYSQTTKSGYQMIRFEKYRVVGKMISDEHCISQFLQSEDFGIDHIAGKLKDGTPLGDEYFHRAFNIPSIEFEDFKALSLSKIILEISKSSNTENIGTKQVKSYKILLPIYRNILLSAFPSGGKFYFLTDSWFDGESPKLQERAIRFFAFCHMTIGISANKKELVFSEYFLD